MQTIQTGSFLQDSKFSTKSEKFQAINPSKIAEVLTDHGFDLVHLKTAKAKTQERADFQTTVARYRSRDGFAIDGLGFDIIFKVPHLYGALQGVLGLFRGVCANQLNVGMHFSSAKIKHTGDPYSELNNLIPSLVAQREQLVDTVRVMQARAVSSDELVSLAYEIAKIRLSDATGLKSVNIPDLVKVRRPEDTNTNLFTGLNVIQENIIRYGVRYQIENKNETGGIITQNRITRAIKENSTKATELNGLIWDAASKLISA